MLQQIHIDINTRIFIETLLVIRITKGEFTAMLMTVNLQAPHLQDLDPDSALIFIFVSHYSFFFFEDAPYTHTHTHQFYMLQPLQNPYLPLTTGKNWK